MIESKGVKKKIEQLDCMAEREEIELNDWEIDFIDNMRTKAFACENQGKTPFFTVPQLEKLEEVFTKHGA